MDILKNFSTSLENRFSNLKLPLIIFVIIGSCFYYLLNASWLRWHNLLVDTPRELWLPAQLLKGKILYKDIFYEYGIFPPYFLALLYKLFGVYINTLVGCGIFITTAMIVLLYKISRFFLDEVVSGLVVVTFLFVFAFSYVTTGIFTFILPYSFASTFFIFFVALALFFFLKFIYSGNIKYLLFWCMALVFAFFSRLESTLPVWLVFIASGTIIIVKTKTKNSRSIWFYLIAPLFISLLGYLLFLSKLHAFSEFIEIYSIHFRKGITSQVIFNAHIAGLDRIIDNALKAILSFLRYLVAVPLLVVGSVGISSYFLVKKKNQPYLVLSILIIFFTICFTRSFLGLYGQYKCLFLILIIGVLLSLIKILYLPYERENIAMFVIFLIPLSLILRIILNTSMHSYGFYLVPLGLIGYHILFFKIFKEFLQKHNNNFSGVLYSAILIIFFIPLISVCWSLYERNYFRKDLEVLTSKGKLYCWPDEETRRFFEAVDYLRKNTPENTTMVAMPFGVSINFFSQRETPLKYYSFSPPAMEIYGEDKIISLLISSNIDYIAIVHRPTPEYGYLFFGVHYAKKLNSWIFENYKVVKQFGPMPFTSDEFGIAILKKK